MKKSYALILVLIVFVGLFLFVGGSPGKIFNLQAISISGFESPIVWITSVYNNNNMKGVSYLKTTSFNVDANGFYGTSLADRPSISVQVSQPDARSGLICQGFALFSKDKPCITKVEDIKSYRVGDDKVNVLLYHFSFLVKYDAPSSNWLEELSSIQDLAVKFRIDDGGTGVFKALVLKDYIRCTAKDCYEISISPNQVGTSVSLSNGEFKTVVNKLPANTNAQLLFEYVVEYEDVIQDYYVKSKVVAGSDELDETRQVGGIESLINDLKGLFGASAIIVIIVLILTILVAIGYFLIKIGFKVKR